MVLAVRVYNQSFLVSLSLIPSFSRRVNRDILRDGDWERGYVFNQYIRRSALSGGARTPLLSS